jgi:hypothetical protein
MCSLGCALFLTVVLVSAVPVSSSAAAPEKQTTETATQFYSRWRSTALNAKSVEEITSFWTTEMKDEFNMEPDSAKAGTLDMVKRVYGMQTDVKVVKETLTPSGATLSLEALDHDRKPVVTSVDIVKENGAWKMTGAVERWRSSPEFHERLIRIHPQPAVDGRHEAEGPVGLGGGARKRPEDGACVEVERIQRAGR